MDEQSDPVQAPTGGPGSPARVLLISQRNLRDDVANACLYQMEDLLGTIDSVDIAAPSQPVVMAGRFYKLARRLGVPSGPARQIVRPVLAKPSHDYELMLAVLDTYRQVATVPMLAEWRRRSRKAVCFLAEIWPKDLVGSNTILELFDVFDHVFIGVSHGAELMSRLAGAPCSSMHPAVDCLQAAIPPRSRSIDVCYIGRRSEVTHRALMAYAHEDDRFYYYDTIKGPLIVSDHNAHRLLLSNLIRHSRYFIANRAKVNQPESTSGQHETGYRFFEGAAGGAVMLGEPPRNATFKEALPWQDALFEIPFDSPDIARVIRELDADPGRVASISRRNMVNALRMHDWVYRYEDMLAAVGIEATPAMAERRRRLQARAERIEQEAPAEPQQARQPLPA